MKLHHLERGRCRHDSLGRARRWNAVSELRQARRTRVREARPCASTVACAAGTWWFQKKNNLSSETESGRCCAQVGQMGRGGPGLTALTA
jgi:hypothetical protein